MVKLLILANHRPATENFSLITGVTQVASVSTIFTLLANCVVYAFHFLEVSNVDVRIGDLSTPRRAAGGAAVGL